MKKQRRLLIRTKTSERVLIRQRRGGTYSRGDSDGPIGQSMPDGKYRLEIYSIDAGRKEIFFEREFTGSIEAVETEEISAGDRPPPED